MINSALDGFLLVGMESGNMAWTLFVGGVVDLLCSETNVLYERLRSTDQLGFLTILCHRVAELRDWQACLKSFMR
jgi:hypothetical protein